MVNWRFALRIYLIALVVFSAFRFTLYFLHRELADNVGSGEVFHAFWLGFRFDTVICCYILALPFLLLSVADISGYYSKTLLKSIFWFTVSVFILAFLVCAADIPWFNQFFSRFNVAAFQWMDHPAFVFKMIISEPRYFLVLMPFGLFGWMFIKATRSFVLPVLMNPRKSVTWQTVILTVIGFGLLFIGVRSRFEAKSPIRIGTAYFSDNSFLNQLGLNPNFTLIRTFLDSRNPINQGIHFMDEKEAMIQVQQDLYFQTTDPSFPLVRKIEYSGEPKRHNVVLVIMESMNVQKMGYFGNNNGLTPFLDSLMDQSLSFTNIYTAGTHTYNGIFSTLFSYPALFMQHPMKTGLPQKFNGLSHTLKEQGYNTIFFTTHDGQFDNAEGFLKANSFDRVVSNADYPSDKDMGSLGVPDDYMFEYGIPVLNELAKQQQPFLSVFLTASDHGPYVVPEYFQPHNKDIKEQIVEYADWSLKKLVESAARQPWFDNTIFVFIADHGSWVGANYDMPLSYHHSPLIYYAPDIIEPQIVSNIGGQIDVFPTLMGLLNLPYTNNTFGLDLMKYKRPYIYFSSDFKYGVLSDSLYLILDREDQTQFYKFKEAGLHNLRDKYPVELQRMKRYAKSHMQAAQMIRDKAQTLYPGK